MCWMLRRLYPRNDFCWLPMCGLYLVVVACSEKGRPQLRRWCCQGPRGVVPPQMDFITCQRGSRIKRVGFKNSPSTVNHIRGSRGHLGFGTISIQVQDICDWSWQNGLYQGLALNKDPSQRLPSKRHLWEKETKKAVRKLNKYWPIYPLSLDP